MWGPIMNAAAVIVGGIVGMVLGKRIKERYYEAVMNVMYLSIVAMGVTSAIGSKDTGCFVVSLAVGTLLGEWIDLDGKLEHCGVWLKGKVGNMGKGARFTEGFVTATLLFCVGSVAIMSSIDVGVRGDYSLITYKSMVDGIAAIMFAASMGVGVLFSGIAIFVYQGLLTMLAGALQHILTDAIVTEMSAVGGVILIGMGLSRLFVPKGMTIKPANMLPAMFLPFIYYPIVDFFATLLTRG